ncbi:hypothetical protein A9Y87_01115 [Salmonella enterica subsp. enterica]|nr:hypothetical protein A9Y87_01115 [Salmonella enterica subsp. enterica]
MRALPSGWRTSPQKMLNSQKNPDITFPPDRWLPVIAYKTHLPICITDDRVTELGAMVIKAAKEVTLAYGGAR